MSFGGLNRGALVLMIDMSGDVYSVEGERIYKAIFKSRISEELLARYKKAAEMMDEEAGLKITDNYAELILNCNDLEALEVVFRFFRKNNILSRRFALMVFIAETSTDCNNYFVNKKDGFALAVLQIMVEFFKYLCKFLIGAVCYIKYKNV